MNRLPPSLDVEAADLRAFLPAAYNRAAKLLATIEMNLDVSLPSELVFGREALTRRLLQEIALSLDVAMRRIDGERALQNLPPLMDGRQVFGCGGLSVDPVSGHARPGTGLLLKSLGGFIALWFGVALFAGAALFSRGRAGGGTVVFGVPEEGLFRGDDAVFAEFARQGPVVPLNEARRLYVQTLTRGAESTDARILYSRYPLLDLLSRAPMRMHDFLRLMADHLGSAFHFLAATSRFPLLAILWRDFALYAPVAHMNERRLIDAVVMTSSNWVRQLLCVADLPQRHYDTHFLFYSQHDRPPSYVDIEERCPAFPNMRLLAAQHFWLWTPGHAEFLVRGGVKGQMHVVGPIQWEVMRRDRVQTENAWISVFDITPLSPQVDRKLGRFGNYYSAQNLLGFLDGIEEAMQVAGVRLPLVIKAKRPPTVLHDPDYQNRLSKSTVFRRIDPATSALQVVAKSAAVIVYPFSTPAYIANWLGKPAIYFDPTGRLAAVYEEHPHIRFARGVEELAAELRTVMARACAGN